MTRYKFEPMYTHWRWTHRPYWAWLRWQIATERKGIKPGMFKRISPFAEIGKG